MKIFYNLLILFSIVFTGCGCSDSDFNVAYDPELYQYVGMYKPGNYWIYENNKGQRDCVFVSDYYYTKNKYKNDCSAQLTTTYNLNFKLFTIDKIFIKYEVQNSSFYHANFPLIINLTYYNNKYNCSSYKTKEVDSLKINNKIYIGNLLLYTDTTKIVFTNSIGIIQWIKKNDTINLIRYKN